MSVYHMYDISENSCSVDLTVVQISSCVQTSMSYFEDRKSSHYSLDPPTVPPRLSPNPVASSRCLLVPHSIPPQPRTSSPLRMPPSPPGHAPRAHVGLLPALGGPGDEDAGPARPPTRPGTPQRIAPNLIAWRDRRIRRQDSQRSYQYHSDYQYHCHYP